MIRIQKINLFLIVFVGVLGLAKSSLAANYYIDYDNGNDASNGTSQSAAWKYGPWDARSTHTASPGNTYCFKGGVTYRATSDYRGFLMGQSGTSDSNRIIYDGQCDGWGTGNAILTNARVFSGTWTRCPDAGTCGGNPNYANIWYASLPPDTATNSAWWQNGNILQVSYAPKPANLWDWEDLASTVTPDSITHNDDLNGLHDLVIADNTNPWFQKPAAFWDSAYIGWWTNMNDIRKDKIDGVAATYNASTHTVTISQIAYYIYQNSNGNKYRLYNHLSLISQDREYAINDTPGVNKIYLYSASGAPTNIEYAPNNATATGKLFDPNGQNYVTVGNFDVRGSGPMVYADSGLSRNTGLSLTGNNIHDSNAGPYFGCNDSLVFSNNTISKIVSLMGTDLARGLYIGSCSSGGPSDGSTVSGNTFGPYLQGSGGLISSKNSVFTGNTSFDIRSAHGNTFAWYGAESPIISGNKFLGRQATFSAVTNGFTFFNNIVDVPGGGSSCVLCNWSHGAQAPSTGTAAIFENTLMGGGVVNAIAFLSSVDTSEWNAVIAKNNITNGSLGSKGAGNASYNCYLANFPSGNNNQQDTIDNTFVNYASGDYRLKAGSLCIDHGTPLGSPYNVDYASTVRPQGDGWDMGAYEYAGGDTIAPAVPSGLRVN